MRRVAYLSVLLPLLTMSLWAQEENQKPVVTNPIAKQLDYEHVLISYEVEDADGDLMTVSVKVSDDGGKTFSFTVPREQLSGEVGEGVTSGRGKEIVWTIAANEFLHVYGENFVIRVLADDGVKAAAGERMTWEKDGSEMVLIPAGTFEMGDHFGEGEANELPVHKVQLDSFYLDVYEVTVGQFKDFVKQSSYEYGSWDVVARYSPTDFHPMLYLDYFDALAYANWVGKSLPTEAEWEYAARGGLEGKRYSWGNEISPDHANFTGTGGRDIWEGHPNGTSSPIGNFEPNAYGLYDMLGNVGEWCLDRYDEKESDYKASTERNPIGPIMRENQSLARAHPIYNQSIVRGGSFYSQPYTVSKRTQSISSFANRNFGFRCAVRFNKDVIFPNEKPKEEMVLIPAGSYEMGEHFDGVEKPLRLIHLDAFYIDTHEVTVGEFKYFVKSTNYPFYYWTQVNEFSPSDDYPMIFVIYFDALAYAKWAGKRLPTEAEWEYAARGGLKGKRYSWGNDLNLAREHANYYGTGGSDIWQFSSPVASLLANGYGLYDMVGNVWEWCSDWVNTYPPGLPPNLNPTGPDKPRVGYKVTRGSTWDRGVKDLRVATKSSGGKPWNYRYYNVGFRCVIDVNQDSKAELYPEEKVWNGNLP